MGHKKGRLEKRVEAVSSTLTEFVDTQILSSTLLFFCIFLAIIINNISTFNIYYQVVINKLFGFYINGTAINTNLHNFVNDFLLTLFFFILGLEIKREFVFGELSSFSNSIYVVLCALGGALLPISVYLLINYNSPETVGGWAIPMATDTALGIGLLYLFKNNISKKTFTLIAALAVIDDILCVIAITIFYSSQFDFNMLLASMVVIMALVFIKICGIRSPLFYVTLGIILWAFLEESGLHGTIAGVIVAMCIPASPKKEPKAAVKKIRGLLKTFEKKHDDSKHILEEESSHDLLEVVTQVSLEATTPLKRWEKRLELPVLAIILPLFALTNGGFHIDFSHLQDIFSNSIFWGIFLGLVCAKPLGIFLTSWSIQKAGIARQPGSIQLFDIVVISFLSGIGYTMSIFISDLSFPDNTYSDIAKLSVFISSLISMLIVVFILKKASKIKPMIGCSYNYP